MEIVDCLKSILNPNVLTGKSLHDGVHTVELEDEQAEMIVSITGADTSIVAIRTGGRNAVNHYPHLKDEYKKICDYLIVWQENTNSSDYCVVLIEMKKTLQGNKQETGCNQLMCSSPIWKHLFSVCNIKNEVKPENSIEYVIISEKRGGKFDKQSIKASRLNETVRYGKNKIPIKIRIGNKFSIKKLVSDD